MPRQNFILLSFVLLVGCANTAANLQRETARFLGGNISENQISVTDVDRGITSVKWKASAPTGNFDCSADDMVRRVHCVRVSTTPQKSESLASGTSQPATSQPATVNFASQLSLKEAQTILNRLGFKAGTPDGIFGKATIDALKGFQKANGLPQSGRLDLASQQALRKSQTSAQ